MFLAHTHDPRHSPLPPPHPGPRRDRGDADREGPVTQRSALDALDARYPTSCAGHLRTTSDHDSRERRPFLRVVVS